MKMRHFLGLGSLSAVILSACQPLQPLSPSAVRSKPPAITNPVPAVTHYPKGVERPNISDDELLTISNKIYQNEASSNPDKLIIWAKGESFASLGIGHFIWYPANEPKRFDETFPAMIAYFKKNKVAMPIWLSNAQYRGAPWPNKETFDHAKNDKEFQQLKGLLLNTKELQTRFFFDRIYESIPQIVALVPPQDRNHVINNYNALAKTKGGWYLLVDYINFKGKGIKASERYNNQGWGLLQALQVMREVSVGQDALNEFSRATQRVLERRVRNSPVANNERRWLAGWINRTKSYRNPL